MMSSKFRFSNVFTAMRMAWVGLGFAVLLIACSPQGEASSQTSPPVASPAPSVSEAPVQHQPTTVVAETAQGPITVADLFRYGRYGRVPALRQVSPDRLLTMPNPMLVETARWIASCRVASERLSTSGNANAIARAEADYEELANHIIAYQISQREVLGQITTPTEETMRAYYEQHLPEFKQPFQFDMRHLILLTYEVVEVQPGDTLESIAEATHGDAAVADQIRADLPGRPLRREEDKEFKPLEPGETLLVPMNDAQAEAVRLRLEEIVAQVSDERTFEDLANEFSESEIKGEVVKNIPRGTRPMLGTLIEMGRETPVGQVSPIFRTKHGWQAIEIVGKIEEGMKPYEKVRDRIARTLRSEKEANLHEAFLSRLFESPNLNIDYASFKDGDRLATDTVVATLGERKVYWGDIRQAWGESARPTEPYAIREFLKTIPAMQFLLILDYAAPALADPDDPIHRELEPQRELIFGQAWLGLEAGLRAADAVTSEAVRAYYDAHKDTRFVEPDRVAYSTMERRVGEGESADDVLATLRADLADLDSAEAFLDRAAQIFAPLALAGVERRQSIEPVGLDEVPEVLRAPLDELEEGRWSEPFVVEGTQVVSVVALKKVPSHVKPFDEVAPLIRRLLIYRESSNIMQTIVDDLLKDVGFEAKLALPDATR